jgi:putative flippase GtrA
MFPIRLSDMMRLVRFAVTGGLASGVYSITVILAIDRLGLNAFYASVIGYLVAIPVSFVGQKFWTFRATGALKRELPGFLAVQALNLLAAAIIMAFFVDFLRLDRLIGVALVVGAIPLMTYILLSRNVFKQRQDP